LPHPVCADDDVTINTFARKNAQTNTVSMLQLIQHTNTNKKG